MSCETSTRSCFCSAVSSFGTNFADTLFMAKSSVTMECAEKVLKPTSSAISRIVKRRSRITTAFTLAMTWSFRHVDGRPERGSLSTDVHCKPVQNDQPKSCISNQQYYPEFTKAQTTGTRHIHSIRSVQTKVPDCNKAYVGQTGRSFQVSFNEHKCIQDKQSRFKLCKTPQ